VEAISLVAMKKVAATTKNQIRTKANLLTLTMKYSKQTSNLFQTSLLYSFYIRFWGP
jgi:hypothetical protein